MSIKKSSDPAVLLLMFNPGADYEKRLTAVCMKWLFKSGEIQPLVET